MFSLAILFASAVASVSAIHIQSPSATANWTNTGVQKVAWTSVITDPLNFTMVLTNMDRNVMPNDQILEALTLTSGNMTNVGPPATGWPDVGGGYRVNFCKDSESLDTILAQSAVFQIVAGPVESTTFIPPKTAVTAAGANPAAQTGGDVPADTPSTGSALPAVSVNTGILSILVLFGTIMA